MSIDYIIMEKEILEMIQSSPHKLKNEKTAKNYSGQLKRLLSRTQLTKDNLFEKKNQDIIVDYLGRRGASTRNQICCALKKFSLVLGNGEAIEFSTQQMDLSIQMRKSKREKERTQIKKDENWIDCNTLKFEFNNAYEYLKNYNQKSNKLTWRKNGKSFKRYEEMLRTAFYLGLWVSDIEVNPPRRATDWTCMKYINTTEEKKLKDKEKDVNNYCVTLRGVPKRFIFFNYKTDNNYGKQTFPINEKLSFVVRCWYSYHSEIPGEYFLKKLDGKPKNVSAFGNDIDKVISQFSVQNKNVRVNMLRNIVITEIYKDIDITALCGLAESCGHRLVTAKNWYIKANNLPSESVL